MRIKIDIPKISHFLKYLVEVWGIMCKFKDSRGVILELDKTP